MNRSAHHWTCWTDLLIPEPVEPICSPLNLFNRSAHPWTCWTDLLIPEPVEPICSSLNLLNRSALQWTDVLNHQLVDEICTAFTRLNGCAHSCSCQINLLIREKLNLNLNLLNGRALLTLVPAEQRNQSCLTNLYCSVESYNKETPVERFHGRWPWFFESSLSAANSFPINLHPQQIFPPSLPLL